MRQIWQCTAFNVSGLGGVEQHIANVSTHLEKLGHEVHVGPTLPKSWQKPSETPLVVHTHGDLWPRLENFQTSGLNPFRPKQDVWIHIAHGTSVGRLMACSEYLSYSAWKGSVRDFLPARLADAVIGVSSQALAEVRQYFRMRQKAAVIANGADPGIFQPLDHITDDRRIAFIGRSDDPVKNVGSLIEAAQDVADSDPEFELWMIPKLSSKVTSKKPGFVKNIGELTGRKLAAQLARCRAVVLVSHYEGDPLVLREAQAMGLPIIASDLPQIRQCLSGYTNALLINPRIKEDIRKAIQATLYRTKPFLPKSKVRDWATVAKDFDSFYNVLRPQK